MEMKELFTKDYEEKDDTSLNILHTSETGLK